MRHAMRLSCFRYTLDRPKVRCLVPDEDRDDTKLLLLDSKVQNLKGKMTARRRRQFDANSQYFTD